MRSNGFKRLSTDDKQIVSKEKQKLPSEIYICIHSLIVIIIALHCAVQCTLSAAIHDDMWGEPTMMERKLIIYYFGSSHLGKLR